MSNHHKTSQNNVTWCYLFNLRYGCRKANHSTLCSGLVGLLRILVICTDAAGCTDAGLVKHFLFKPWTSDDQRWPATPSSTWLIQFTSFYILLHQFLTMFQKTSENCFSTVPGGARDHSSLPPWPWDRDLSKRSMSWPDDFAWLSDFWVKTNDRSGISRNFQQHLFDPCSYNATTFSKPKKNITVHGRLLEYIGVHDAGLVSTTHPDILKSSQIQRARKDSPPDLQSDLWASMKYPWVQGCENHWYCQQQSQIVAAPPEGSISHQ